MAWFRRRRWYAAPLAAVVLSPLLSLSSGATAAARVRTINLPANLAFSGFAVGKEDVSLVGTVQNGPGIAGDCDIAPLKMDALSLGATNLVSCSDPELWGEPVSAVETAIVPSYNQVLRVTRLVDGRIHLGQTLATYQANSGSHPVYAYGADSLWIYENQGPHGPTIFRVSLRTGDVLAAVRAPDLVRPALLANDDGAWLIPAGSFGAANDTAVYHLAPGLDRVVSALTIPHYADGFAAWAVATGHDLYGDFCPRPISPSTCTTYGLSGPSARLIFHRPSPSDLPASGYALGGPDGVYVIESDDVTLDSPSVDAWPIDRLDTSTGQLSRVATVTLPEFWSDPAGVVQPDAILLGRSILFVTTADMDSSSQLEEVSW